MFSVILGYHISLASGLVGAVTDQVMSSKGILFFIMSSCRVVVATQSVIR